VLVAAALPFSTAAGAQYGSELGKLAPEAMKGGAKPRPMQVKQIAPDLLFFWNDGSLNAAFLVTTRACWWWTASSAGRMHAGCSGSSAR